MHIEQSFQSMLSVALLHRKHLSAAGYLDLDLCLLSTKAKTAGHSSID